MKFLRFLLFFPGIFFAQIPAGYYSSTQGLKGQALRNELHEIIKNNFVIPYSGLWSVFPFTDSKANGKVWDIYSFVPGGSQPYEYTFGANQCGNYTAESHCYNREHSWPQSWFAGAVGPDSDLFHIYPTDGFVNAKRGNFPYGNVGSSTWTSLNGSKLGNCVNPGYSSTVFEPINEFKGDLARTFFYMTTRYLDEDASWSSSPATNKCEILLWQRNVLLQWHHQDPVSQKEIARNDSIYRYQGNRNPFIDAPAFADSIWLSVVGIPEISKKMEAVSIYPVPAENKFYIESINGFIEVLHLTVRSVKGEVIFSTILEGDKSDMDCSLWNAGVYFIEVKSNKNYQILKFIKL
jgi:endonuclease I